ncbi:retrovirus-related pol polyprotein from transposon TNT 1-94 [Tanacetum coccineum]
MKDIFEELEAEVDQNVVHRKHAEIKWKNLLIANDNLIADCLSKDAFYIVTNSELTVSRFTEMHDAHIVVQTRCLELEAELSKLRDKIQHDNHNELVKPQDAPDFDSVFLIEKMKASIQGKDNAIKKLRMQISQLNETRSEADRTHDFRTLDFPITQLTEKVNVLQEQNELFRAENGKITQHYKELYDSIKITRAKHIAHTTALLTENENLKVQIHNKMQCVTTNPVKPRVLAPGKYSIDIEQITPRKRNNREVHLDYLKHLKESVETIREIVEEAKVERPLDRSLAFVCLYTKHSQELLEYVIGTCSKDFNQRDIKHAATSLTKKKQVTFEDQCETLNSNTHKHVEQLNIQKTNVLVPPSTGVVQIVLWYLDSGCSKHMTRDRSRLRNFVKKFIRTVRFKNDHFGVIMGYGDYVIGENVISRVYYVEGLGHNLFSVGQFYDSNLEVAFRKHSCYVRDMDGVELIKGSRGSNLYTLSVEDMMKSSSLFLLSKASKNKSWLWHRRLNHLNFGTINDLARKDLVRGLPRLKFKKDHLCSACQLGKSKKHTHKPKTENTNLEVLNTLHMDLCGPMRVQTINGKKYIFIIVDDYSRNIRTNNGTEFVNKDLTDYYERVRIFHQKTVPRGLHQRKSLSKDGTYLVEAASKDLETYNQQLILDIVDMTPSRKGPGLAPNLLTPGPISLGLVPNPPPAAPYVPLTNKELAILFQSMFDDYFDPYTVDRPVPPVPATQVQVNPIDPLVSISFDQDAPLGSHSPSSLDHRSSSVYQGLAADNSFEVNPFAPADNEPFVNTFAPNLSSKASSSREFTIAESNQSTQPHEHLRK